MFYVSSALALLVAIVSTGFSVATGANPLLSLAGACAVGLLCTGLVLSWTDARAGIKIASAGSGVAAAVILTGIVQVVRAEPLRSQIGRVPGLGMPAALLLILFLQLILAWGRWHRLMAEEPAEEPRRQRL